MSEPRRPDRRLPPHGGAPGGSRRRGRDERGVALLLTAIGMVAMLVVVALVVDVGFGKQFRRQSQASADAAALAAAQYLSTVSSPSTDSYRVAAERARELSTSNEPQLTPELWSTCFDPEARANKPSSPWVEAPAAAGTGTCVSFQPSAGLVRVVLPRVRTPGFFGGVAGGDGFEVNAMAEAKWRSGGGSPTGPCGLCVIDQTLQIDHNQSRLEVRGGKIAYGFNLNVTANSSAPIQLPLSYGKGGTAGGHEFTKGPPYPKWVEVDRMADPWNTQVVVPATDVNVNVNNSCEHFTQVHRSQPGPYVWRQNVDLNNGCTLDPGTYYFGNQLTAKNLKGVGVTLVFVGNGKFSFEGPGNVITAPTAGSGEPYPGYSIITKPTGAGMASHVRNGGALVLNGKLYMPGSGLEVQANGNSVPTLTAASAVISGEFKINGAYVLIDPTLDPSGGGGGGDASISLFR